MLSLLEQKITIPAFVTERRRRKDQALRRFRKAVVTVIRIIRRRKMKTRLIEKYSLIMEVGSYQLGFTN